MLNILFAGHKKWDNSYMLKYNNKLTPRVRELRRNMMNKERTLW
jgi:very-short-patch-repair endonuclease